MCLEGRHEKTARPFDKGSLGDLRTRDPSFLPFLKAQRFCTPWDGLCEISTLPIIVKVASGQSF